VKSIQKLERRQRMESVKALKEEMAEKKSIFEKKYHKISRLELQENELSEKKQNQGNAAKNKPRFCYQNQQA
jgi:hypothetical protein